jgi:hypothetical protein
MMEMAIGCVANRQDACWKPKKQKARPVRYWAGFAYN